VALTACITEEALASISATAALMTTLADSCHELFERFGDSRHAIVSLLKDPQHFTGGFKGREAVLARLFADLIVQRTSG
jgi:hypothetical protein